MDLKDLKTIKQCIDVFTTDAYEEEITSSWENCLNEIFSGAEAELAGQSVKVIAFCGTTETVLAKCKWRKNNLLVTLDSLEFKNLNFNQKIWLKAYLKWQSQGWAYHV